MRPRKYSIDDNFFNRIDTEEKAYWLGFLYADGTHHPNRNVIRLCLHRRDIDAIEKIRKSFKINKPYRLSRKVMVYIDIVSKNISKNALRLGLIQNKTFKLTFPNFIHDKLLHHFIRGYSDGDGCIIDKSKAPAFEIVGTIRFCGSIAKIVRNKLKINFSFHVRHPDRKNNIVQISFGGRHQVKRFLDWLYKDANLYLDRKYQKYINIVKEYRKRYVFINGKRILSKNQRKVYSDAHLGKRHSISQINKFKETLRKKRKTFYCLETNEEFKLQSDACKKYGLNYTCLSLCLNGKINQTGGYHFEYK